MKATGPGEPVPPRVVKPRTPTRDYLPIIAVDQDHTNQAYIERTGEVIPLGELAARLTVEPSSMIMVQGAARLLHYLDTIVGDSPTWQYRVTPHKRQIRLSNGEFLRNQVLSTVVNFFGWKSPQAKKANLYHYPLDPYVFALKGARELQPQADDVLMALFLWGHDVRAWCREHGLKPSATSGGLAAQLLRDERFFPLDRRKVPRATNAIARPALPGNHYHLYGRENRTYQAYYLDMKASHHTIAASLDFPHPDSLYARGHFRVTDVAGVTVPWGKPWVRVGTRAYRQITENAHGLLYAQLTVPTLRPDKFAPPYMRNPGQKMAFVYTNELPMIRELGGVVDWITAAWVSFETDQGLNRLARWALQELDQAKEDRRRWMKPTLLASYGILAARPRASEYGYRQAAGGVPREYPAGPGMLKAQAYIADRETETPIANVIYRGMIEAEQRKRALDLARYLHSYKCEVIAVYADSVFTTTDQPLPMLPPGWGVDAVLDGLVFTSPTHFISRQLTKLPGMPREGVARLRRMEQIRQLAKRS